MPVLDHNQNEYKFYLSQLSKTSGNIYDLERHFLRTVIAGGTGDPYTLTGTTVDLWIDYLTLNGATSRVYIDAWKEFLVAEGYTVDSVYDTIEQYFIDNT